MVKQLVAHLLPDDALFLFEPLSFVESLRSKVLLAQNATYESLPDYVDLLR